MSRLLSYILHNDNVEMMIVQVCEASTVEAISLSRLVGHSATISLNLLNQSVNLVLAGHIQANQNFIATCVARSKGTRVLKTSF